MWHRRVLILTTLPALACAGLDPRTWEGPATDLSGLEQRLAEPVHAEAQADAFLIAVSKEPIAPLGCVRSIVAFSIAPTDRKTEMLARAAEPSAGCPLVCGKDELLPLLVARPDRDVLTRAVLGDCDAHGPDPLFSAETLPLRPFVDPARYVFVRTLYEQLAPRSSVVRDLADELAMGLVLTGRRSSRVESPGDVEGLRDRLQACSIEDPTDVRLVFDPSGALVHRAGIDEGGSCFAAILDPVRAPPGKWSLLDLHVEPTRVP